MRLSDKKKKKIKFKKQYIKSMGRSNENMKNPGNLVITKTGKRGRTYHSKGVINGKFISKRVNWGKQQSRNNHDNWIYRLI